MTTHPTPSPHDAIAKVREALEDCAKFTTSPDPTEALAALASLEYALTTAASAHRAGQEEMRERVILWHKECLLDESGPSWG